MERLSTEDVEMEDLNFYYADYSRSVDTPSAAQHIRLTPDRIYNDVITLRKGSSYMYAIPRVLLAGADGITGQSYPSHMLFLNPLKSRSSKNSSVAQSNKQRIFLKACQRLAKSG